MKSILVTGGAGFIGSHTCLLLLEKGYVVFILDSFVNSSKKSITRISAILKNQGVDIKDKVYLCKGDINNLDDIEKVFQLSLKHGKRIESVIHFAGLKSVYESVINPINYWNTNVSGTINLLQIMDKYNCKSIVFSSSATIYRAKSEKLLNENDICEPINPYGNTKFGVERILQDLFNSQKSQWRIVSLRYFNPVGAHESALIGEDPLGSPNNIFPRITQAAIGKIKEIKIFGSDWPTPDGTGVRDYIHVNDLAEGHLLVLEYISRGKPQILNLNIGTGIGTSVLELINTFQEVNNVKIPYSFAERRKGDTAFIVADNSLSKSILNWEPKRNIEEICRSGWKWQLNNPEGY